MVDNPASPLADRAKTVDPNECISLSPEYRRAQEARAALRAQLKRQYLLQLNNPHRRQHIEDPALKRWEHARANPYMNFKPTFKTSLLGATFGVLPLFVLYFVFKSDRDRKEAKIKAGTLVRNYNLSS